MGIYRLNGFTIRDGKDHHMYGKSPDTLQDVSGQTFGELKVLSHTPGKGFTCLCACGRTHIERYSHNLRKGLRTSCGKCKRKGYFSREEDQIIMLNAGKLTLKEIGKLLGRTRDSIKNRAGLLRKKGYDCSMYLYGDYNPCTIHSEADVELVRKLNEANMPLKEISEKMEISISNVQKFYLYYRRQHDRINNR